jgi:putative methyltransferase (TIGR04325 family)
LKHAYCTYFDHSYLPRGLLTLRSLRAVDPETPVFVLALSSLCETVLRQLAEPGVTIIPLAELEAAFPELPALKPARAGVDYIFTLTPFLPLHLFATTPAEALTYIDADLYFYADPRPLQQTSSAASIAITPHRFSPDRLADACFGRFNVGWVGIRRDPEGLACLERYRQDCLAWCHDRVEPGRYADQGYLDTWPEQYRSVAIVEHKGVNLALWNVDNYRLDERDGRVTVDDEPLIFYHFHGVRPKPDGSVELWLPKRHGAVEGVLRRRIYAPYVDALTALRTELHRDFPDLAAAETELRYRDTAGPAAPPPLWNERGAAWPAAGTAGTPADMRHDDAVSRALVAEFAAHAPGGIELAEYPVLAAALAEAADGGGRVSVLDWGGGVGLAQLLASRVRPDLRFDWHVVDTPSRCAHGSAVQPELTFHTDLGGVAGRRFDLVLAIGSLGAEPDWQQSLQQLRRRCGRALLLDRIAVTTGRPSFVVEHHAPSWPAKTLFTSWILEESALLAALRAAGFTVRQSWASAPFDWPFAGTQYMLSVLCTVPSLADALRAPGLARRPAAPPGVPFRQALPMAAPPSKPVVTLRTPRLILRDWRDADLAPFAALSEDPEGMRYYPAIPDRAASDGIARYIRSSLAANGFGFWAVEVPGQAAFIGYVGMAEAGFAAPFTPAIELSWRLARPFWGHGYATEAAGAVLDHAFGALGFHDVVAYTVPDNLRSRRVMERLGMQHDSAGAFDDPRLPPGDPLRRQVLYRLSAERWASRKTAGAGGAIA